jgi:diguanylate cyclase (GGDEF)-like protein
VVRQVIVLIDNSVLLSHVGQAQEAMRDMAYHDPLTGLANRALLDQRLTRAVSAGPEPQPFITLFFIDLDDFKEINDELGHAAGDRVLVTVAQRLRDCVRDTDLVARLGGDEFGVLLDTPISDIDRFGQRLLHAVSQPLAIDHRTVTLTACIGATHARPGSSLTTDMVLSHADQAMYAGKRHGKNQLVIERSDEDGQRPHRSGT